MRISLFFVLHLPLHPCSDEDIGGALGIQHGSICCLENREPNFIILAFFRRDVPLAESVFFIGVNDLDPAEDCALGQHRARMEELPVLDWLVVYLQPRWTELSVIQIDQRLSDEIIAKEIIVVVGRNLHRLSSWK